MKNFFIPGVIIIFLFFAFITFNKSQPQISTPTTTQIPTPAPTQEVNIRASFTIITGNITRSFKAEKYHNQSKDVYIQVDDPTIIHGKKKGITYDDFFKTLPMKLTADCLITGDGETLCDGEGGTLKFYLNNFETPELLEKEIMDGDKALIKFIY